MSETIDRAAPKLVPELLVQDFARSLAFYHEVLGFRLLYGRPEEQFACLDLDGAELMLDQRRPGAARDWVAAPAGYPYGRGVNFEIDVADVVAIHDRCAGAGAIVFLPLEERWYRRDAVELGVRQFIVLDPDGYMLRFSQSIGQRPAQKLHHDTE